MNCKEKVYCGVDVSKLHLDVLFNGRPGRFANTIKGVESMMTRIGLVHYVLESTVAHPKPSEKPSKEQRLLCALVDRRQQLSGIRTAEISRLETAADPSFLKLVKKHVDWIEKELKMLEKKIAETISSNAPMKEKNLRIQCIKGLGKVCAATLLAHIPEIGTLSRQEIAALAGHAPYNRDSGTTSKRRHIHGGRKRLRACLYMAAVSATQHNPVMKEFYIHLVEDNHRPKKVALTAVMRKLIIAANSAVNNPDFCVVV